MISDWCEWLKRRPQGQYHLDQMLARGFAAFCNTQRSEDDEPLTGKDFLFYEEPEVISEEAQRAQAEVALAILRARQSPPQPAPTKVVESE